VASSTATSNSNPDIKVYSNYDFVPGANILFEDNFQDDQDGEFPAKWDLEKGQAVLNKVDGELALFITQGNYAKLNPRMKTASYLTDPFTVETDYYVQAQQRNGIRIFIECTEGEKSLWFAPDGGVSSDYFPNNFSAPFPDANAKLNGHWHHAAFIFKNGQMKCYVDQYRVLLMPNTQVTPVSIKFGGIGDMTNPMIFKNVRIASGGAMNMIGKKFTDAKIVTHGINFDYGKASIRPESMGTLNMIKEVLIDNPELKFEIGGHTDNDGDGAYNLKLSQDRADAVRSALIDLGIDGTRLTTKGYGLTKPIGDNNTPEGKANNRRVEFVRL
jgi:OOP family OmpA-OmpF porin